MKFGVIGRTSILIAAARRLISAGHKLTFVAPGKDASFDGDRAAEFNALAGEFGVPRIPASQLESRREDLRSTSTDVALSVNCPFLIQEPLLSIFPFGILNAHAGDLPRYRGNAPANWAIIADETSLGLTIHRMTEELDAGPILLKRQFPLTEETYIGDVYSWLEQTIPILFEEVVSGLATGQIQETCQSSTGIRPLRTFPRKPEDSQIDWHRSATEIFRLIRASSIPFSGAFTRLDSGTQITIWRARLYLPDFEFMAVPGQVCFGVAGDPVIACGEGMLRLTACSHPDGSDARPSLLTSLRNRLR